MRPPRVSRRPLGCQVQCRSSVLKRLLRSLVMVLAAVWLSGCADGTRAIGPPVARKKTFQEDKLAELVWYVERMAGPRLLDCGQHLVGNLPNSRPTPKVLEASLACGLNAAKQRKPFWTFVEHLGEEGSSFSGLLGTSEGAMYGFLYDSTCRTAVSCPGEFKVRFCSHPAVERDRRTYSCGLY